MFKRALRFLALCSKNSRTRNVSMLSQFQDFLFFRKVTGMSPLEFHLYELWDRQRPVEERLAFMSHDEHRELEAALNPREAVDALNDKKSANSRLREAGVRLPRFIDYIDTSGQGAPPDLNVIVDKLILVTTKAGPHGLVIKPNAGEGGQDIHIFNRVSSSGLRYVDGATISFYDLAKLLVQTKTTTGWNAEDRLIPHPALARLAPHALSTLRVQSMRTRSDDIHVGPIVLKVPLGNNAVDNLGAGNLIAPVNLDTGQVGAAFSLDMERDIKVHPDSGAAFEEVIIPDFAAVKHLVTSAANTFKELGSLGWDVALTPDGPVILEGNAWWGEQIQMPLQEGLIQGEFAKILESHGLGRLLTKRAEAAREYNKNRAF